MGTVLFPDLCQEITLSFCAIAPVHFFKLNEWIIAFWAEKTTKKGFLKELFSQRTELFL